MIITIYNKQKDLSISSASVKKLILLLLERLGFVTDEISVHFLSAKEMGQVHLDFFSDPSPTDSTSFPIDSPIREKEEGKYHVLGELFVCPQVAIEYAQKRDLDPYKETMLYVIHGLLHLLGYDDLDPVSKKQMRQMEKKCLQWAEGFSLVKKTKEKYCSNSTKRLKEA